MADTKSIVMHYVKGWFVCDLLAALPFDVLYAANLYSRVSISPSLSSLCHPLYDPLSMMRINIPYIESRNEDLPEAQFDSISFAALLIPPPG